MQIDQIEVDGEVGVIVRNMGSVPRAVVRLDEDSDPICIVLDDQGNARAAVCVPSGETRAAITLFNSDQEPAAGLTITSDGELVVCRFENGLPVPTDDLAGWPVASRIPLLHTSN